MHTVPSPSDRERARLRHPSNPLDTPWDRRLTPDAVLGARDPKVAALLARTDLAAGR